MAVDAALASRLDATAALDVSLETLGRDDGGEAALRAKRADTRASLAGRLALPGALSLRVLAAATCFGTTTTAPAAPLCDRAQPAGRVGLVWEPSRAWTAFAVLGRYARVPTLGELYGIAPLVHGNPSLRPETGETAELGGRLAHARAFAGVSAFARRASDLVSFVRSSQGYVVPQNLGSARVLGAELDAGVSPFPWLLVATTATLLDPRDTTASRRTTNTLVPFQSRLVVAPRVRASWTKPFARAPWLSAVAAEARFFYQSGRVADPAGLAVLPAQTTFDVELSAELFAHLRARTRASDLFNATRFDVVGYPLPRRSFYASLEATW